MKKYNPVEFKIDEGTNSGDKKRLSRYGITHLPPNNTNNGNHYVSFKVKIPKMYRAKRRQLRYLEGGNIKKKSMSLNSATSLVYLKSSLIILSNNSLI